MLARFVESTVVNIPRTLAHSAAHSAHSVEPVPSEILVAAPGSVVYMQRRLEFLSL